MPMRIEVRRDTGKVGPAFGPWIRRKQVARPWGDASPDELVEVIDHRMQRLGWGLWSPTAAIAVRMVAWGDARPEPGWLHARLTTAIAARAAYGFARHATTGYREVHSEGDGLPGLVVDRYGADRVVQIGTAAMAACEPQLVEWLAQLPFDPVEGGPGPARVFVVRPESAAKREGIEPRVHVHPHAEAGAPELAFVEHGLRLQVPAPPGQKTGAYHDQRDNRLRVAELAASHGGPLLDVGCHVGGFALQARRRGIEAVGLDRSAAALACAAANARANGLDPVAWVQADMFGALDAPELAGPFGTVVADPPRIANSRRDLDAALPALQRLVGRLLPRVAAHGHFVLCSCSHHLDGPELDATVLRAGGGAWTRALALGPGADHPVTPGHVEGDYLRVHVYQRRGGG